LVEYVDDLLIYLTSGDDCRGNILTLLGVVKGHGVPEAKLQLWKAQVTYRGHVLSGISRRLSNDRVQALLNVLKPKTRKEMRRFFGIAGYCRVETMGT